MSEIVAAIARVSAIVRGIAQGSARQTDGVELVDRAIARIDDASRQNAALVQHGTEAAHSLEMQAALLVDSVAVFRLNSQDNEVRGPHSAASTAKPLRAARASRLPLRQLRRNSTCQGTEGLKYIFSRLTGSSDERNATASRRRFLQPLHP